MKYSKQCECCGHIETAFTYTLNVGKVSALRKLVDYYEVTKKPVQLGDLKITNSQYTNFCHLVYFGLAKHVSGGWEPTEKGILFIENKISVMVPQVVMNGKVLEDDHEAWATHTKERKIVTVRDIHELSYKKYGEYAEEVDRPVTL